MDARVEQAIQRLYAVSSEILDERGGRLWAAVEAGPLGREGVATVARATGLSRTTIYQAMGELAQRSGRGLLRQERTRAPGVGRKRLAAKDPQVLENLERLVDPVTQGDPTAPLRWTLKSTRQLAGVLTQQGHPIGRQKGSELLGELGYSLQANRKTREGWDHADCDAQFVYTNQQAIAYSSVVNRSFRSTPKRRSGWAASGMAVGSGNRRDNRTW